MKKNIRRNEIWMVQSEKGMKPVLVISNNVGNHFADIHKVAHMMKGIKRKPTQLQHGEYVVMFESKSTYSQDRFVEKIGEVNMPFQSMIECSTDPFTTVRRGVYNLHPENQIQFGDIYWLDMDAAREGEGVGREQRGHRMVMVVSNNFHNTVGNFITVTPITSRLKAKIPTHVNLPKAIGIQYDSTVLLEHEYSIHKKYLGYKITTLPREFYEEIQYGLNVSTAPGETTTEILNVNGLKKDA